MLACRGGGNCYGILGLYWDNGKEDGNYFGMLGLYWDHGKIVVFELESSGNCAASRLWLAALMYRQKTFPEALDPKP